MKLLNFSLASFLVFVCSSKTATAQAVPPNISVVQITTGATGANALSLSLSAFSKTITIGNSILVLCGSGNFSTTNWTAAFTDNVGNVYKSLGAPVANSTTQAAFAFQATVTRVANTVTGTVTLSGSSSAATALACAAYELSGVPSAWQTVGTVTGQGSSGTATPMQFASVPIEYQNEMSFVGVAAASGTCSLTSYLNNFYTLDTTLTPATSNVTTFCTSSSVAGNSSLRADPITLSGSVANAEIAVTVRNPTSPALNCNLAAFGGTRNNTNQLTSCGVVTENGTRFVQSFTPAASSQATLTRTAGSNNRIVVDKICFSAASTTAPALTQLNITVAGGVQGTVFNQVIAISAVTGQNIAPYCTPYLGIVSDYSEVITAQWSAALTNLFEAITMVSYSIN